MPHRTLDRLMERKKSEQRLGVIKDKEKDKEKDKDKKPKYKKGDRIEVDADVTFNRGNKVAKKDKISLILIDTS